MGLELIRVNPDGEKVQFRPDAAASFRRMEAQQGRDLDVNRTVVTWDEQNDLYQKRQRGEYPYSVAHPDESNHVYRSDTDGGSAWDTDERGDFLEENGWIADVADEPWHRHYIPGLDRRRNDPAPTTTTATPNSEEETMKPFIAMLPAGRWVLVLPQGNAKPRAVTMAGGDRVANPAIANFGQPIPFDTEAAAKALATAVDGI